MKLFESLQDLGKSGYLFRILDNGGESADRYTVIFCDGDALALSGAPSHPQGVSQSIESVDVQWAAEEVEARRAVDLQLGDLPENVALHVLARINEGWADFLGDVDTRKPHACAPTREAAEVNEGLHDSAGKGIYSAGDGYCVRLDGRDAAEDRGPYMTAREALQATLPLDYSLSGPEYHSSCDPGSLKRARGTAARIRALERRVERAQEKERRERWAAMEARP